MIPKFESEITFSAQLQLHFIHMSQAQKLHFSRIHAHHMKENVIKILFLLSQMGWQIRRRNSIIKGAYSTQYSQSVKIEILIGCNNISFKIFMSNMKNLTTLHCMCAANIKIMIEISNIFRHKINRCEQRKIVECCRCRHFLPMALCIIESFHYFNNHNENAVKYFSAHPKNEIKLFVLAAFNFISGKPMSKRLHIA